MQFKKLVVTNVKEENLPAELWVRIDALVESKVFLAEDAPNLMEEMKDADILFSKFNPVSKELMAAAPNLKYVGVFASGYGKVDLVYAKEKGIVVTNIPGYSTESVAEFTFAVILERLRELEEAKVQARGSNYDESNFTATEIKGKKFGIIGLGKIGTRVAELAKAFGAEVIYNDHEDQAIADFTFGTLDTVISTADILSFHLTLSDESKGLMNAERMNSIKESAIVVNTAPMEIFDIDALAARLEKGDITFILDHSDEMAEEDLAKLSKFKNCVIYPPIGYITKEASAAKLEIFVNNLEAFAKGESVNVVS